MMSNFHKVDESFAKIVGEQQLKSFVKFSSQYAQQLSEIENALGSENNILWNPRIYPISLKTSLEEKISLPDLITSEYKVVNKVITVLSALCLEIQQLEKEAIEKFYDPFLFYGETGEIDKQFNDGDFQLEMGRLFPLLQKLWCFGQRCRETVHNIVQQMAALYNKALPKAMDTSHVHFTSVYEHLCTLLRVLISIDEILDSNSALRTHWDHYKSMVKSIRHNHSDFGVTDDKLRQLEKMISKIGKLVINANLLENCFDQDFDDSGIPVTKNLYFAEEFLSNIKLMLANIDNGIGSSGETDQRFRFVGLCGVYVFHYKLFHSLDKKLFKQIWDMHKKIPCVCLSGHVTWFPDTFLSTKMPQRSKAVDGKMTDLASQSRLSWLSTKAQSIPKECQTMYSTINNWLVELVSGSVEKKSLEGLKKKMQIFIEGYILANTLRATVDTVMNLHAITSKPMTKQEVLSLCRMMTMSKAVASAFNQHSLQVVQCSLHAVQYLQNQITSVLDLAKKRVASDKRYSERRVDILYALVLCERCVNGAPTPQRLTTANIALSVANQSKVLKDEEFILLLTNVEKLSLFGTKGILQSVNVATDHSAFYWQRSLIVNYFNDLCKDPTDASRLQFMFAALQDCVVHLKKVKHLESSDSLVNEYRNEVMEYLKQNLLDVICKKIENDLRLSVHTHLKLDNRNPFKVGIKSLRQLLSLRQMRFLNNFINVKAYVIHYLDQTFYNLTTVALHDWKTYSEMRTLAYQKYQLNMQEVHLPNQQLEQGLDVLEIMRNIHVFVSKYLYNLNNQIFVESSSNNKHLNTINIRHIANSIRTHGTGIMNTTVNFTFQFLKKKFYIFSQFLFDEHIKSRLIKDIKSFRENKDTWNQMYPYDKADKFNRGIRRLGLSPDGSSYLDQFRLLISHIGNAMGYIRMVRSGGLHCCSDAIRFVPDFEEIANFEEIAEAERISEEVSISFFQFDSITSSLVKNSAEGSDYLSMLVEVFAPEFRSSKNLHLKNFYTMIPPLTLNHVEHAINCKEKMSKKNKLGAAFTDDGFAMGLAYILKLLDQYNEFDSLHWFQSVRRKHAEDVKLQSSSNDMKKKGGDDEEEKLQQTKALALKRISIYQREFELLYYSLSSARIFFRAKNNQEGK